MVASCKILTLLCEVSTVNIELKTELVDVTNNSFQYSTS